MSKGDVGDITLRLFRWLPSRWFPFGAGSRIWATLSGFASSLSAVWDQIAYLRQQTRLTTVTDGLVDLASYDFLGNSLPRRKQEQDRQFAVRIRKEVLRERNTRKAVDSVLFDMVGTHPDLFEAFNPLDCGGWDVAMGWDTAGLWGDLDLMNQMFVNTARPRSQGVPEVGGWDSPPLGWDISGEWTDATMIIAPITDAMVFNAVANVTPAGMIVWMNLEGFIVRTFDRLDEFVLDQDIIE